MTPRYALSLLLTFSCSVQASVDLLYHAQARISGVAIGSQGEVYFSQESAIGATIQRLDPTTRTVTRIAGGGSNLSDGPALDGRITGTSKLLFDGAGHLLFTDTSRVRSIDLASGMISTIAGTGAAGFGGDGGPASIALLNQPSGLALDASGNLYIADTMNRRIRRIDASTRIIRTVAGNGQDNYSGSIGMPTDVAMQAGLLYFASPSLHRVFRLDSNGIVTPAAGNGAQFLLPSFAYPIHTGDGGGGTLATMCLPSSLASSPNGLLIGDELCSSVRQLAAGSGAIETVVASGAGAEGNPYGVSRPEAIATDGTNIYIGTSTGEVWRAQSASSQTVEIQALLDGTTFTHTTASPGALVSIIGNHLGGITPSFLALDGNGRVKTELDGVQVFFNDVPAPLLYVSAAQINVVVPYGVSGELAVRVSTPWGSGVRQNASFLAQTSPGFFAVVNGDGSVNSFDNPSPQEGIVIFYGTGMGRTNPPGVDGAVYSSLPLPMPAASGNVLVNRVRASVQFLGQSPNYVSGVVQGNVVLPPNLPARAQMDWVQGSTGSTGSTNIYVRQTEIPSITRITQVDLRATVGEQELYIEGTNFEDTTMIDLYREGERIARVRTSSSGSPSTLIYSSANFGGVPGNYAIEAVNSGNRRSPRLAFTVLPAPPSPPPAILLIAGEWVTLAEQRMRVFGNGILPGASVELFYEGVLQASLSGDKVQYTQVEGFFFLYNFQNRPGNYAVEVVNPGGARSNRFTFTLKKAPQPVIFHMDPGSVPATQESQVINFGGTTLMPGLTVDFFRGASLLRNVPSSMAYANGFSVSLNFDGIPGSYGIEVVNPDGQRSARYPFTVGALGTVPTITSINPASPIAYSGHQGLAVNGTNFLAGLSVAIYFNDVQVSIIPADSIANVNATAFGLSYNFESRPGNYGLEVINPGGGRSARFLFTAVPIPPVVAGLSPYSPGAINGEQAVQVFGERFRPGLYAELYFNGNKIATLAGPSISDVVNGRFTMTVNFTGIAGAYGIEVINPDGGRSARYIFTVNPAGVKPVISHIAAGDSLSATEGGQGMLVSGSNFQSSMRVEMFYGGQKIEFLSQGYPIFSGPIGATQVILFMSFEGRPGNWGMEFINPDGTRSDRFNFVVLPPAPEVFSVSPASPIGLNTPQTIRVFGKYFTSGLTVDLFFGASKVATISSSGLDTGSFNVTSNFDGNGGTWGIEVINPNGRRSARFAFQVAAQTTPVVTSMPTLTARSASYYIEVGTTGYQPGGSADLYYGGAFVERVSSQGTSWPVTLSFTYNFNDRPGMWGIEAINPGGQRSSRFSFPVSPVTVRLDGFVNSRYGLGVAPEAYNFQANGQNFAPGLHVDVFDQNGALVETIAGGTVQTSPDSVDLIWTNSSPSTFGFEIVNPSGNRSARIQRTFFNGRPQITSVTNNSGLPVTTASQQIRINGGTFLGGPTTRVNLYRDGVLVDTVAGNSSRFIYLSSTTIAPRFGFASVGTYEVEVVYFDLASNRFSFTVGP